MTGGAGGATGSGGAAVADAPLVGGASSSKVKGTGAESAALGPGSRLSTTAALSLMARPAIWRGRRIGRVMSEVMPFGLPASRRRESAGLRQAALELVGDRQRRRVDAAQHRQIERDE